MDRVGVCCGLVVVGGDKGEEDDAPEGLVLRHEQAEDFGGG